MKSSSNERAGLLDGGPRQRFDYIFLTEASERRWLRLEVIPAVEDGSRRTVSQSTGGVDSIMGGL